MAEEEVRQIPVESIKPVEARNLSSEEVVKNNFGEAWRVISGAVKPEPPLVAPSFFRPGWTSEDAFKSLEQQGYQTDPLSETNSRILGAVETLQKKAIFKASKEIPGAYDREYIDEKGEPKKGTVKVGDIILSLEIIEQEGTTPKQKQDAFRIKELFYENTDVILGEERISYREYRGKLEEKARTISKADSVEAFDTLPLAQKLAAFTQAEAELKPEYKLVCAGEAKPEAETIPPSDSQEVEVSDEDLTEHIETLKKEIFEEYKKHNLEMPEEDLKMYEAWLKRIINLPDLKEMLVNLKNKPTELQKRLKPHNKKEAVINAVFALAVGGLPDDKQLEYYNKIDTWVKTGKAVGGIPFRLLELLIDVNNVVGREIIPEQGGQR